MNEGLTRREMMGASALALALPGTAKSASAKISEEPSPRLRERLVNWRFHLGHASDVEKDFGFGRDQQTFAKAGQAAEAAMPKFDDSGWSKVVVPHDWAVALPFAQGPDIKGSDRGAAHGFKAIGRDFPDNSVGWYRTSINVTNADRSRRIWLEFDGVFRDALVFVNGYAVARNASGYAPFCVPIDDFLDFGGANVVTVRADASLGEGWFYEGAGIYRHVDLVRADPLHIVQWGTVVRSHPGPGGALVEVATEIVNTRDEPASAILHQSLIGPGGEIAAVLPELPVEIAPGETRAFEQRLVLKGPRLWSLEDPYLYRLRSLIKDNRSVVDRSDTRFGIRSIHFDGERGFFLNGRPVKLLGTANHQDHAGVGTGIDDALNRWRVAQLKSMGSNAWRSAHNPPSTALLDACDEMGMLMICEQRINSSSTEAISQLERMVRRDRNHPSVILWSLGNEEPHQSNERGRRINSRLEKIVKRLDPSRPTTFAMDKGWETGVSKVVDVLGFNYRTGQMEGYHKAHPGQPVFGSETGSTVATRGEYSNDPARHVVRAYDTEHPWWASTAEEWWTIAAERPYIAGGFVWTGFDYRGEPTPYASWPSISSQFGILDTCGFPKDDYFYYRAWWRPDEPLVHILPHWNWNGREGRPIEVWVHGNTDEVELTLNGRSLGRKTMPRNRHLEWQVPYERGRLDAVGYNRGQVAARDSRKTSGPAHAVRLALDRRLARAGEVVIVNAAIVDARGNPCPADSLLSFSARGGEIIGVGNGNPNSLERDTASARHAFNGLAQAIVRVGRGPVDVAVTGTRLAGARARIMSI